MIKSNLHTHTTYCDGKSPAEDTVRRALELGYESLGFSSHSYFSRDEGECLTPESTALYRREILALREKYRDRIEIYLGTERDLFAEPLSDEYDYVIGSTHCIMHDGAMITVDCGEPEVEAAVRDHFGGDWYEYCRVYFESAAKIPEVLHPTIIGHFDLVKKFNGMNGRRYFDETSPRYTDAAVDALRYAAKAHIPFEINTAPLYRNLRDEPYLAPFLLRELKQAGGEIVLSSDSHKAETLGAGFDIAAGIAKDCGFRYAKVMHHGVLIDELL